jgi:CheY-specific phosphatase CheX
MDRAAMTPDDRATITAMVSEIAREMFSAQGPFEELLGDVPLEEDKGRIAALVGLSGDDLRGALVMVARPAFFRATYPPELGEPTESDLGDWAREAVNQLLGRVKNRFARYGVNFNIATPTVVAGDYLRLRPENPMEIKRCLRIGSQRLDVYFHMVRDDGKGLLAHGGPPVAASVEGDALLF